MNPTNKLKKISAQQPTGRAKIFGQTLTIERDRKDTQHPHRQHARLPWQLEIQTYVT
jgi:hypothetical protein